MQGKGSHTQYISSFINKLSSLQVDLLSIEKYPKEYLLRLLENKAYYLHIYAEVLDKLVVHSSVTEEHIILVDYGAGNGLLGMFAKHCGYKKVYLNDISASFLNAAEQVATAINISLDGFIIGDCKSLKDHFTDLEKPTAIVGTDVIEHIYSLENFFRCIHEINPK